MVLCLRENTRGAPLASHGVPDAKTIRENLKAANDVGDAVTWSGEHELIPAGTVGKVLEIRDDGKRVVEFPGATKAIKTMALTLATAEEIADQTKEGWLDGLDDPSTPH
jgi:hypothetical protein